MDAQIISYRELETAYRAGGQAALNLVAGLKFCAAAESAEREGYTAGTKAHEMFVGGFQNALQVAHPRGVRVDAHGVILARSEHLALAA